MKRYLTCPALVALIVIVSAALAAPPAGATRVVCRGDDPNYTPHYRKEPRKCTFHKRGEPLANAWFVHTHDNHWHQWGQRRARGRGKAVASMTGDTPVRIRLFRPRFRCGRRVFTRARFYYPEFNRGSKIALDLCA
jgi:hypothetical protein